MHYLELKELGWELMRQKQNPDLHYKASVELKLVQTILADLNHRYGMAIPDTADIVRLIGDYAKNLKFIIDNDPNNVEAALEYNWCIDKLPQGMSKEEITEWVRPHLDEGLAIGAVMGLAAKHNRSGGITIDKGLLAKIIKAG